MDWTWRMRERENDSITGWKELLLTEMEKIKGGRRGKGQGGGENQESNVGIFSLRCLLHI